MSSAVCFNLDQSKVLWFGNQLMVLMALETKAFLKALWKKEKMVTDISFSYSTVYLCHLLSSSIIPSSICMFISCVRNFSLISGWIWIKIFPMFLIMQPTAYCQGFAIYGCIKEKGDFMLYFIPFFVNAVSSTFPDRFG